MEAKKKQHFSQVIIGTLCLAVAILFILPFIMVISGSLTSESDIFKYGYQIIPKHVTFLAYKVLFSDMRVILNSYFITISTTVIGTFSSVLITAMIGYAITRKTLKYRKAISFYCLITMLFSGGMVPWYIVCINYLHLKDQFLALILPYLVIGWNIFLMRNFLQTIPDEIYESAKIDGAGELTIMMRITMPMSKAALATISPFVGLTYWNDWWLSLMLIDKEELRPIQYMLRSIVSNISFLRSNPNFKSELDRLSATLPTEGIRMAASIIAIGPILFLYPFLQNYFVKGIMIGAVKG